MMPETLTLQEAMQLASQMPQNAFNPFNSFEAMVKEAQEKQKKEILDNAILDSQSDRVYSRIISLQRASEEAVTDAQRAKHGFYKCVVVNENYDPLRENRTSEPLSWELKDNVVTATYQVAPKPLSQVKEEKRSAFKALRDEEIAEPINGVQVGRLEDRENIEGAISRFETIAPDGVNWIMVDNSVVVLTKQDLQNVADEYAIRKAQIFNKYGTLSSALDKAETIDEVLAVEW